MKKGKKPLSLLLAALLLGATVAGAAACSGADENLADLIVTTDTASPQETDPATNGVTDPVTEPATEEVTDLSTAPETEAETDPATETEPEAQPPTDEGPIPEDGVQRPISKVTILPGDSPEEAHAAAELTKYLEMKGVTMVEDGYAIRLQIDPTMAEDSYRIAVFRKNKDGTTITGGNGRGVLYGVYRFLEEQAGIRFFTPDLEVVPEGSMVITTGVVEYEPFFELRQLDSFSSARDADWCVKMGLNRGATVIPEEMGGEWSYYLFVHSMCEVTGTPHTVQPCLTDPAILEYAKNYVRTILETKPKARIISISQNDNTEYCKCESCAAVDAEEGSPAGTLLRFINAIAADIAEDYPDVIVDTLAYQYTQPAPKITKPLPNVCVRLCPVHSCAIHTFDDPECNENQRFAADLVAWSKICNRLYIWDYTTSYSYYIPTYENLLSIRDKMRFYADHNVKGMFPEGNYQSVSGEFGELRSYLLAKLMQNPYMTEKEYNTVMNEFLKAYYGEGWRYVRAYIEQICHDSDNACRAFYFHPLLTHTADWYRDMEPIFDHMWDKAEEMAGDRLEYVQRSRLQWRYIKLMYAPNEEEAQKFVEDVTAAGIYWSEGRATLPDGVDMSKPIHEWY